MIGRFIAAGLIAAAMSFLLLLQVTAAGGRGVNASKHEECRPGLGYTPGWSYGDGNHSHSGPPGQCVAAGNGHADESE